MGPMVDPSINVVLDNLWLLLCAALILLMQPGFMCVEAGLTRSKNNIGVAIKNIADFSLSILLFWFLGYGLMFGTSFAGWFGTSEIAFSTLSSGQDYVHFIFQAMFCGTAATILSGAVAERCRFGGYLMMTAISVTLIYPIFGHWVWSVDANGDAAGWLANLGFRDFAGSGVVHAVGGGVALAAILVLGPREGRFPASAAPRRFNGSNLPLAMLGVFFLWFGWFGFNGGSAGSLTEDVPAILVRTFVAASAGVLTALAITWVTEGKPSVFYAMNGSLGGLVAVTAGCDVFSIQTSIIVGMIGGAITFYGDQLLERLRIDDVVGAVPVHFLAGLWGLLATAIFGTYGADADMGLLARLGAQLAGIVALIIYAFAVPYVLFRALDAVISLRVTAHVENIGVNVGEHGANTDLNELFDVMQRQARDRDLSMRAPQSPFTEVGQIGLFYNSVIFELERSFDRVRETANELEKSIDAKNRLLESVLPKRIASRINEGEQKIVDQVRDATVVFVDVVDFTSYAMSVPAEESIDLLKRLFGSYDKVIADYELEKIKTIGDCYMFVAGVSDSDTDHCALAIDAALDLQFATAQLATQLGQSVQVRIGVHSGPLMAGVVGDLRFVYDLWGSTVNIASRIEEAGKPGKITVSEAVVERIGNQFVYEKQRRTRLKGVGSTVLYSIEGRRAALDVANG
ncbi:MAG: ammonium transporter [Pseudomonadota bacterium]